MKPLKEIELMMLVEWHTKYAPMRYRFSDAQHAKRRELQGQGLLPLDLTLMAASVRAALR